MRRAKLTFNDLVQNTVWSHFRVISRRFWRGLRFVLLVGLCTKRRPWSNLFINANLVASCFCFDRELCSSLFRVISSDFKTILTGSSFCTFGGVMYKTKTQIKTKSCCFLFLLWSRIMFQPFSSDFKWFQDNFDGVFVLYFWWGYVQNEDPNQNQILLLLVSALIENYVPAFFEWFQVISRQFWRGLRFVLLVGLCTKRRPKSKPNLVASCFCFDRELCSSLFRVISSDFKTILTGSSFCTFGGVMYKTKTLVKFVHKRKSCCSLFLLWSRIMFQPFSSDFK